MHNNMPVLLAGSSRRPAFPRVEMLNLSYCILEALRQNTIPGLGWSKMDSAIHRINRYQPDKYWENQLCYLVESELSSGQRYPTSNNWRKVFYLYEPETMINSPILWTVTQYETKQKSKALEIYFRKLCLKPNIRNFCLDFYSQQLLNGSFCVKTKRNVNVSLPYPTEFSNLKPQKNTGGRAYVDDITKISDIDRSLFSFFCMGLRCARLNSRAMALL